MSDPVSRRGFLASAAAVTGVSVASSLAPAVSAEHPGTSTPRFRYCLNTSTIREQKLSLVDEVELAAKAGYDGIEPWMREIEGYVQGGGSLADLRKRIEDRGLKVESAIGFAKWIVDDEAERKGGLEQARRDMDLVRQISGTHIAAPPVGATQNVKIDLFAAAERYADLLRVGKDIGVIPQVEVWGFSANLSRLGEATFVAIESGHPDACLLPDVYHIYKGGSDFAGLKMIAGTGMHCFHVNDYPAEPARPMIADRDRVYPGDGVAPLTDIFRMLATAGFQGALSLELFNPTYWQQDPLEVAKTGLEKMKAAVGRAFG